MGVRRWVVETIDEKSVKELCESCEISETAAALLVSRGLSDPEEAQRFLECSFSPADPFSFADMDKAVARINQALDDFEKIAVYGDYDADGITATALLYSYLEASGGNVIFYIPSREGEGYGLHKEAIDKLKAQEVSLIVTVDNGISALEEIAYAKTLGMDVVVTDHHLPGEILPDAAAVVNPHRADCGSDFKFYAGVGVAFELVCAMDGDFEQALENYADLVALGTIADVMPLTGRNRAIVQRGLAQLQHSERVGLRALSEAAGVQGKKLTAGTVAFSLIPRINAAGRVGSPYQALELLLCEEEEQAAELSLHLSDFNTKRQEAELVIIAEAEALFAEIPGLIHDPVLVFAKEGWHPGIIGIAASRLVDKYGKPVVMITIEGEEAKGSSRSLAGFSIHEALTACAGDLLHFGGHKLAAGLSLKPENIDVFRKNINRYALDNIPQMPVPVVRIDAVTEMKNVNMNTVGEMAALEPFGQANPTPVLGVMRAEIASIYPIGQTGKHIKIGLTRGQSTLSVAKFNTTAEEFPYTCGEMVDVALSIDKSVYKEKVYLSAVAKDFRFTGFDQEKMIEEYFLYERTMRGESYAKEQQDKILPNREDFANVYRFLKRNGGWKHSLEILYFRLGQQKITYGRMCLCLDALEELKLITTHKNGENIQIELSEATEKADLESSELLQQVKARAME